MRIRSKLGGFCCAALVALGSSCLAGAHASPKPADEVEKATLIERGVLDEQGRRNYIIVLNDAYVNAAGPGKEPAARSPDDERNAIEWRGWHRPETRRAVAELEADFGLVALTMTSWGASSFSAFVSEAQLQILGEDRRVDEVVLNGWQESYSSWVDQTIGGYLVPWGKDAIGTNDLPQTTSNVVYVLDGAASPTSDLWMSVAPVNASYTAAAGHGAHVLGILGAKGSPRNVLGINPNSPLILVKRGSLDGEVQTAMDWILVHTENFGRFSITNLSSSGDKLRPDTLNGKWIRKLSNRTLFVIAAGNDGADACDYTYGTPDTMDGILSVGAIGPTGARAVPMDNSHIPGYGPNGGSNYGACVQVWAPGKDVYSLWTSGIEYMSGTSMAAPHVSALAARYGDTSTSPVEREQWIRAISSSTGYNDPDGLPIRMPSLANAPAPFATKLPIFSITASSTLGGTSTAYLTDGLYLNPVLVWNSGGPSPAWLQIDLGSVRTVRGIRLVPEQDPAQSDWERKVYVHDSLPWPMGTLVEIDYSASTTLHPISIQLNTTARYIRVESVSGLGWVAYREVEVYGQ